MDLSQFFTEIAGYFFFIPYSLLYLLQEIVNMLLGTIQPFIDIIVDFINVVGDLFDTLFTFVAWIPSATLWIFGISGVVLFLVIGIRVLLKLVETVVPGGLGGWLK